jgi:hypothetical protein
MKQAIPILLFMLLIFLSVMGFITYYIQDNLAPIDNKAAVATKPTKKWHPGHYIYHKTGDLDPQVVKDYYKDPRYDATAGIYTQVYWKSLEAQKDVYTLDFIQQYLDALPDDKQLFIVFMDRDYRATSCGSSRLPGWVDGVMIEGCVAKYWEQETMDEEVELLSVIAEEFDDHPQFEGVLLQETSFGGEEIGLTHDQMYEKYYELHEKSKGLFKKSHLLRNMNSLGGPEKSCKLLGQLAEQLEEYGYGMANPDSNAWDAMPWDCVGNDNVIGELPGDKVKPVYALYRKVGNRVPKLVGNDGSQLGNPYKPRMFNGEKMDIPNLVKYHYLTAVEGYTHKDFGPIEPFGANYLMWLSDFWTKEFNVDEDDGGLTPEEKKAMKEEWDNEVLKLINRPGYETNTTCPSNINCQTSDNPVNTNTPTPSGLPNTPTPLPSTTQSVTPVFTPTPTVSTSVTQSPATPTITPSELIIGNICGKADIDGDGRFNISDFAEFAKAYGVGSNSCADKDLDYGPCGGRDVNKDGKLNIADFGGQGIGFAQRYYPKLSCVVN